MSQLRIEITLPAAPQQAHQHVKRVVVVTLGGVPQPPVDVEPGTREVAAFQVDAAAVTQIGVSVVEVLANGKQSAPAAITFNPADHVEALAADPAGFVFRVTPVAPPTDPATTAAQPADAQATATQSQIDPATGRVIPHV